MKESIKFNSQVCTTKEQSERLLKLGLNPETADMHHFKQDGIWSEKLGCWLVSYENIKTWYIPAWSLHRLVQLMPPYLHFDEYVDTKYYITLKPCCLTKVFYRQDLGCWIYGSESSNLFDAIIDVIEYLIFGNHFNKEYLSNESKN